MTADTRAGEPPGGPAPSGRAAGGLGPIGRLLLWLRTAPGRVRVYYREIVAELRKVIYPTRSELVTYVVVVLIFVTIMVSIVAGLDYAFTRLDLKVFGG